MIRDELLKIAEAVMLFEPKVVGSGTTHWDLRDEISDGLKALAARLDSEPQLKAENEKLKKMIDEGVTFQDIAETIPED